MSINDQNNSKLKMNTQQNEIIGKNKKTITKSNKNKNKPSKTTATKTTAAKTTAAVAKNVSRETQKNWETELNKMVSFFNKNHANVLLQNKNMIMKELDFENRPTSSPPYIFMRPADFKGIYLNTIIQTGEKRGRGNESVAIYNTHAEAWLKNENCRVYKDGVVFNPYNYGQIDNTPKNQYNLYKGFGVKPAKGDCSLLYEHIYNVLCGSEKKLFNYVIGWIAYKIQNIDKPGEVALILRGKKGSGKGTLGNFLMSLYGAHALHISNSSHLTGKFNGHLEMCLFLFADEAFFSNDKAGENVLKTLVTEKDHIIERKGFDAQRGRNFLQILMATNHEYAVPASADERRWCVLDVSDKYIKNYDYFKKLHNHLNLEQTKSAFLYDMLNKNLNNFNVIDVPETAALAEQRRHSLDTVGQWLLDAAERGYFENLYDDGSDKWMLELDAKALNRSYLIYCKRYSKNQYEIMTSTSVGKILSEMFPKRRKATGFVYIFDEISIFIDSLERHYKIKIDKSLLI